MNWERWLVFGLVDKYWRNPEDDQSETRDVPPVLQVCKLDKDLFLPYRMIRLMPSISH